MSLSSAALIEPLEPRALLSSVTGVVTSGAGITSGSGDLNPGKTVSVTVNFDSTVNVGTTNGSPTLSLNDGGTAVYIGGSGTSALNFLYTVSAGENTSDLTVTAFNRNGSTIQSGGIDAILTGAVTNPAGTLQIDTTFPTASISLIGATNQAAGSLLQYSVTFTEPVTGVTANGFSLTTTGVSGASISSVTQGIDAAHYTVNVASGSGQGIIGLNITGTSIRDLAGNGFGGGNFAAQQTLATSSSPFSVVIADVNGDGKADLVVANENSNSVGLFLGNGNGSFAAQQTFATGVNPVSVVVADVNGDGRPDLIVANNSNMVSVLLQNSNGTFAAQQTFAAGSRPRSIAVADLNGDGKLDIVVTNLDAASVSLLLGNGNGTFAAPQSFQVGTTPRSIVVADFNGDGKPDLAVANASVNSVSILLGNGNGTFAAQQTFTTGTLPFYVSSSDFNGDGKNDLVVVNEGSNSVGVLLGNGNGTFSNQQTFSVGQYPVSAVVGDVNGDGKPDLTVANFGPGSISVLLGNGNGTFSAQQTFAAGGQTYSVALGDLNGDGKPDLAAANEGSNTVSVFLNGNSPQVGPAFTIAFLPPVLSGIESGPLAYKANDPAFPPLPITSTAAIMDPDSNNLTKLTVQISSGYQNDSNGHDVLAFTNKLGITGSFDPSTGMLTLTGSAYVGYYREALRSITFSTSGTNLSTANRVLTVLAYDDSSPNPAVSQPITRTVTISTANVAPTLAGIDPTPISYVQGTAAVSVSPAATISDPDSINLASVTIQITGNFQVGLDVLTAVTSGTGITQSFDGTSGTLTLSGIASLASYQAVLRSVAYNSSSFTGSTAQRTLTFFVNDGIANSNSMTRVINVAPYIFPPVIGSIETLPLAYKANQPALPISNTVTVTSPVQNNLTKLTIQITSGYQNDANGHDVLAFTNQLGITGSFDATTGTLTLSGTAYIGTYREALRTVTFSSTGTNVSTANRILTMIATDDGTPTPGVSVPVTRTVLFNFPPVVTEIEPSRLVYTANSAPEVISSTVGITDPDSNNLSKLTVQITSGYQNNANGHDVLAFTNMLGITGSFDAATGTLTLTGIAYDGNYREALRTVTYSSTGTNVSTADRILTIIATDDSLPTPAVSKPATRTISAINLPPVLGNIETSPLAYTSNSAPVNISNTVTAIDPDSNNLTTLTVQITSGYQNDANGHDVLSFTNTRTITGSFDAATGKLTLTGTAYIGDYREALRSVTFSSSGSNVSKASRVLTMIATDDGAPTTAASPAITRTITVS